jgi:hypothetical protein
MQFCESTQNVLKLLMSRPRRRGDVESQSVTFYRSCRREMKIDKNLQLLPAAQYV